MKKILPLIIFISVSLTGCIEEKGPALSDYMGIWEQQENKDKIYIFSINNKTFATHLGRKSTERQMSFAEGHLFSSVGGKLALLPDGQLKAIDFEKRGNIIYAFISTM